jgi:hypothetical protein
LFICPVKTVEMRMRKNLSENLRGKDHLLELDVDGRIYKSLKKISGCEGEEWTHLAPDWV